ncbi:hypothetical protein E4U11_006978, partial [Claviceps purpurea]
MTEYFLVRWCEARHIKTVNHLTGIIWEDLAISRDVYGVAYLNRRYSLLSSVSSEADTSAARDLSHKEWDECIVF